MGTSKNPSHLQREEKERYRKEFFIVVAMARASKGRLDCELLSSAEDN